MRAITVSLCRIQYPCVQNPADYGFHRSAPHADSSKRRYLVQCALALRCRIRFRPESILRLVVRMAPCTHRSEPQWQPACPVSHRERRAGHAELELAQQRLERQQSCAPLRNSLRSEPRVTAGFGFAAPSARTTRRAFFRLSLCFQRVRHISWYQAPATPMQP